ncbi:hypothetical protein EYZ11_011774 [Aspergillus tanneri]|uniref:Uncharacterized protein n=1 Tax=Aspergillus tanneri TaxID=1220188 RepID=A0A4S3J287_9EURO|nr:hypothetical protein EYZ11_011774 [Aspergillus tanneri]
MADRLQKAYHQAVGNHVSCEV